MTTTNMKAGMITAKLRDAVPVCFFENDAEQVRYKNIDIPDTLKELEITGFEFDVPVDGKISFRLYFAPDILPTEFPQAREKKGFRNEAFASLERVKDKLSDTVQPLFRNKDSIRSLTFRSWLNIPDSIAN